MDYFRLFAVKLLFKPVMKTGITPNKITILNFLLFGIFSLIMFGLGHNWLALVFGFWMAMFDYIDGEVARATRGNSKLGQYLDTSLDWLYLMLLIGVLSYTSNCMFIGYIILIALTFGNWVEYNGKVKPPFSTCIIPLIVLGIILEKLPLALLLLMFRLTARTFLMYWRSVWNQS